MLEFIVGCEGGDVQAPGRIAYLQVVSGAEESAEARAFEAMLDGWRAQQLSRNLAFPTIDAGARVVRRFQEHTGRYPWRWTSAEFDAWMAELRDGQRRAHGTLRGYQLAVRGFLGYVCRPCLRVGPAVPGHVRRSSGADLP